MTYISAWSPKVGTVVYKSDDGSETTRHGGSRSWRNCNPGNIQKGSFADACGAIGGDSRFAIFPDEAIGLDAIVSLLQSRSYAGLTLDRAIYRYAPASENDSGAYVRSVVQRTGIPPNAGLNSLSIDQLRAIASAFQQHEGWVAGVEERTSANASPHAMSVAASSPPHGNNVSGNVMPDSYFYEQATGLMHLFQNGNLDLVGRGYSGSEVAGGKNNPAAQCQSDVGPLPRGTYRIGAPILGPSPYSLPLTPSPSNFMCGRSNFLIHGDSIAAPGRASHGCIILSRPEREQIVASGIDLLTVVDRMR